MYPVGLYSSRYTRVSRRSGLPSNSTRSRSRSTQASGSRTPLPLTRTRPAAIHFRASVRDPRPAFDSTRSSVFSGRMPCVILSRADGEGSRAMLGILRRASPAQDDTRPVTIITNDEAVVRDRDRRLGGGGAGAGGAPRIPRLLGRNL